MHPDVMLTPLQTAITCICCDARSFLKFGLLLRGAFEEGSLG